MPAGAVIFAGVSAFGYILWRFGFTMCCNLNKIWKRHFGKLEPSVVTKDRVNWGRPHQLFPDGKKKATQLEQIENFTRSLQMCYIEEEGHKHFFITDGTWTIEFKDVAGTSVNQNIWPGRIITEEFPLTPEVKSRMQNVCGATNYSLALRNSEHLARFIHCGAWISFQMIKCGEIRKMISDFSEEYQILVNTLPTDLKVEEPKFGKIIYKEVDNFHITFTQSRTFLDEEDNDAFNIIFFGPTGSGKSTLINHLYNQKVVKAASSVHSVTRQIQYTQGKLNWAEHQKWNKHDQVNVIDTIGFCDTELSSEDVHCAIQSSVRASIAYIDKVVIVCSGRIEPPMVRAILKIMKWLQYEKFKKNFVFIYNKSDNLSDCEREESLLSMCSLLGADPNQEFVVPSGYDSSQKSIKLVQALGFGPGDNYSEVKHDLKSLKDAVFSYDTEIHRKRIPVEKGMCTVQ